MGPQGSQGIHGERGTAGHTGTTGQQGAVGHTGPPGTGLSIHYHGTLLDDTHQSFSGENNTFFAVESDARTNKTVSSLGLAPGDYAGHLLIWDVANAMYSDLGKVAGVKGDQGAPGIQGLQGPHGQVGCLLYTSPSPRD